MLVETITTDIAAFDEYLQELLEKDHTALKLETAQAIATLLYHRGRLCRYSEQPPELPKIPAWLLDVGARRAGDAVLELCDDKLVAELSTALADMVSEDDRDYGEMLAVSMLEHLEIWWAIEAALDAYLAATSQEELLYNLFAQNVGRFKNARQLFEKQLQANPQGQQVLQWVRQHTHWVDNMRAMLPAREPVPWFLAPVTT
jgi:hypothetical protein